MKVYMVVISALLMLASCKQKTDVKSQGRAVDTVETVKPSQVEESQAQVNNNDIERKDVSSQNSNEAEAKMKTANKHENGTTKNEIKKTKKSVPKPTNNKIEEKVENVVTEVKDKSVPKPEKKDFKEKVENVEIKSTEKANTKATKPKSEELTKPATKSVDHTAFHELLSANVNNGNVNYKAFKAESQKLDGYLDMLSNADVSKLTKSEKLAFWINAYNANTIKKIIDNYPVQSITDLDGGKPWDTKWIKIDNRTLSLNNIENDIIRPTFNEPRIHFAVNCAAISCPPILNKAWSAGNLNTYLEQQAKSFINDENFNVITPKSIKISKIFDWYKEDFGDIITFLNKYSDTKINSDASVEYLEYNWKLNGK